MLVGQVKQVEQVGCLVVAWLANICAPGWLCGRFLFKSFQVSLLILETGVSNATSCGEKLRAAWDVENNEKVFQNFFEKVFQRCSKSLCFIALNALTCVYLSLIVSNGPVLRDKKTIKIH